MYWFRGKDIDTGKWVYGFYWNNGICNHFIKITKQCGKYVIKNIEVDPKTVGQYVKLKDIKGEMIFEGDILRAEHFNYYDPDFGDEPEYKPWIGVVAYRNGDYFINTNHSYNPTVSNTTIISIRVLGNVYDNPELLEVADATKG